MLAKRETYGVGRLNDTVADVALQLVLGRERDDEVARRRVILVPKREVGGRVHWLFGFEWESVGRKDERFGLIGQWQIGLMCFVKLSTLDSLAFIKHKIRIKIYFCFILYHY